MTQFRELTDRYTLEKILRSSRAGTVLRATDNRTGQDVAVKLITVTSPPLLVQKAPELEKLGAALESLREPALPAVTDSGFTTDGSAFLVMELLEGKTLDTLAGPPQRFIGFLAQALDGLEALARKGVAHQNLSPDNLLVVGAPPAERVKILGLGGALFRTPGPAPAETARFRAPELAGDAATPAGPIDARADLFSFAMTACQVLGINVAAGEPPSAQMPFALSLELENAEVFRKILERCLRRNPAERPSHHEIRDAFRLAVGAPLGAPPAPPPAAPKPAAPKLVIPSPPRPPEIAMPPSSMPASPPPKPAVSAPPPAPMLAAVPGLPVGQASAAPASAAPPAPAPAEESQELLPAIDDDFLNSLATAPPAAAEAAAPAAGRVVPFRGAGSAAAAAPPPAKPNPLMRPGVLLGVAGALILAAIGAFWWLSRDTAPPEAVQAEAPAIPPPPPRRPALEVLAEAQEAMADERWESAYRTLGSLNGADQATLTPAGCRALSATEESLARIAADRLPDILAQGLKKADLGQLRFAVWIAEGQGEATLSEALRNDLLRGRSLLDLYAGIEEAAARKADTEVLERFAALDKDFPNVSDPEGYREKAAASLEAQAEELARQGKYQDAQVPLDSVLQHWPKRQTARERSDLYRRASQLTPEQEAILEKLPLALSRNKPHEGLEMLRGVEPVPHLAAQLTDFRKQLTEKLDFLDKQPPTIELRDGFFLDYDRGQVVEISFRVKDDYLVRSVKLMARPEGGRARELPLDKETLGYTAKLPPDFHRNGTVELWVVATDASGHEGFFGTPDQPKLMQRRQGFNRLVN